jgi:hypothetical protein
MRLSCGLLVGVALLANGCWYGSSSPSVVAISGRDSVRLGNREQVHDALGPPISAGIADGTQFEEFQLRGGFDQVFLGFRERAFHPLEEFHVRGWGNLRLIEAINISDIPSKGENQVVVAGVGNVLHFRIFDQDGNAVIDTDETKLPSQVERISDLKNQLTNLWPPHKLTERDKIRVIAGVATIVGQIPLGSFELGQTWVGATMLTKSVFLPDEKDRHRVFPGQILRFDYDQAGEVTKVYVNGKLLLSAHNAQHTTPGISSEDKLP